MWSSIQGLFNFRNHFQHIWMAIEVVMLEVHLYIVIWDDWIRVAVHLHLNLAFDISQTCELVEVPSESKPSVIESFIACWNETSSFDQIVPLVIGRSGEVFIDWMDFELFERVDWSDGVLPNISHDIVEISNFEHVNRVRWHPILHVDVSNWLILPIGLVSWQLTSYSIPFVFSRETSIFSCFCCSPVAESPSFQVIYFCWPVPGHVDLFEESSKLIMFSIFPPKEGHRWPDRGNPLLPFLSPILWFFVASIIDKAEVFAIRDQHLTGLELLHIELLDSKLVIPAISCCIVDVSFPFAFPGRNWDHFVLWNFFKILLPRWALDITLDGGHILERHSSHDNCWGFEMDPLVFDSHQENPHIIVPVFNPVYWWAIDEVDQHMLH